MIYNTFDEVLGIVYFRSEGRISASELYDGVLAVFEDPRFHPDLRLLGDHTRGDFSAINCSQMADIAKLNKFSLNARKAIVVRDPLQLGLGNVLSAYHEFNNKPSYRYFYQRNEALAFLNDGFPPDKYIH